MESKTRLGYKPTEIGRVPKEWEVVRLGDVINVLPGFAFSSRHFNKDKGVPLIRIRDLGKNSTEAFYSGPFDDEYIVNPNEILVGMDGEFNAYLWKGSKSLLNQRVCKIWPKDGSKMDRLYLYYVVHRPLDIIEYRVGQTTVKHLSTNHFDTVFIPFPPLPEQRRIAEILSTVDEAIQRVDEAIARTERLKRGLMQRLLTRGIGHTKFKFSRELGCETPVGWEIVKLENVVEIHDSKRIPLSEMERANRKGIYPYCGANGIIDYIDDYIFDGEFILLAEDGGAYGKFENTAYIMSGRFWVNNHAHILKALDEKTSNLFLLSVLNFLDIRRYIVGSTRTKLNQEQLREIKLPLPPLPEQRKITEILSAVDKKLELERNRKEKLERIKKGLINDLLTGKVRVRR